MKQGTKITTFTIGLLAMIYVAGAVTIWPFAGWERLIEKSPDIIIGRSIKTPALYLSSTNGAVNERRDGVVDAEIEVLSVLRGVTNKTPAVLSSQFWPRQGEHYLIFARFNFGFYQAFEPYRVIPLGIDFPTNILSGKSLEEQIQVALKWRLDHLKMELQEKQEEKKRLEDGVKK